MTDHESFLGRWSRLKRQDTAQAEPPAEPLPEPLSAVPVTAEAPPAPAPEMSGAQAGEQGPDAAAPPEGDEAPPLPPIESLGADSDYKRFLAPDVPEELRRLAMRRAWVTDPKISSFRGFGEYDWDFNAPGYGRLLATDDIGRLLDAVCHSREREPPPEAGEVPVAGAKGDTPAEAAATGRGGQPPQPEEETGEEETGEMARTAVPDPSEGKNGSRSGEETSDPQRC
jgi:Protein of unknown function (DUF3306)